MRHTRSEAVTHEAARAVKSISTSDPSLYLNRDLGLLAFQERVLEEAQDPRNRLLERLKFLSILFSNLDEFFMIRVARLQQLTETHMSETGADGLPPSETLRLARERVLGILKDSYTLYNQTLAPALNEAGIRIVPYAGLTVAQRQYSEAYFHQTVFPVLTPLAFDPGRPFPHISNLSLSIGVMVSKSATARAHFGRVRVPGSLDQLVKLPKTSQDQDTISMVWLDEMIAGNLAKLFPGMKIHCACSFHVTRDAEVAIQELESDDLLETIEEAVWSRRFRDVVRLQVPMNMPCELMAVLQPNLKVEEAEIYPVDGMIDLGRLKYLDADRPDLKDAPYLPATTGLQASAKADIFARIRQGDVLLHHPFESFQPVVEFLRKAAHDPDVLAIKATLYRVGRNSPIVQALLDAVENGKQVAVLVELKARFDEESNIEWAKSLESEGVHIVYGLVGLKVHSKVMLVVRRESDKMRRYMHLGTGNYNPATARLYTDLGLFTCNDEIGEDVSNLFNYLTGYSVEIDFPKLLVAPVNLRSKLTELIEREMRYAQEGSEAHLIFKMNALEDPGMIDLIYRASQAGVKIDLLVRGLCCLRPGVKGISDNVRVISIVGRYLEHSRAYFFRNGGHEQVYLGSADLMPRNLNRRVEVLFPVDDLKLMRRVKDQILATYLADRAKARFMRPDGSYVRSNGESDEAPFDAQAWFMDHHRGSIKA